MRLAGFMDFLLFLTERLPNVKQRCVSLKRKMLDMCYVAHC